MSTYAFDQTWELEQARLQSLEDWLDPGSKTCLQRAGVAAGSRCLDVGGGRGSVARWLSQTVGAQGRVLVTDIDTTLLEAIDAPNVEVRKHDITTGPPEPEAFDVAHARAVIGWIPERDKALAHMIDALAPGGVLVVEEIDFVSFVNVTESAALDRVRSAMFAGMKMAGYDFELGRKLPGILTRAGLEDVEGDGRVAIGRRLGNPGLENFRLTLMRLREMLLQIGPAGDDDFDEVFARLDDVTFEILPPTQIAAWGRKPR